MDKVSWGTARAGDPVRIRCTKFDGSPSWSWTSVFKRRDSVGLWLKTPVRTEHSKPAVSYQSGRDSAVLISPVGMWMARFYEDDGTEGPTVYLDVALPPVLSESDGKLCIDVVDLDLDVVLVDGSVRIDDEDEFLINCTSMGYPAGLRRAIRSVAMELAESLSMRKPPFDIPADELLRNVA